ncbi:MAG: hypothetical protein R3D67_06285 [Hyphomicrobiaceae bacterium]
MASIFPGQRRGKPLSSMALEMVLRRMGVESATVHGFAPASRLGRQSHQLMRELAEHALSRSIGDKAEQAYRRDDAVERAPIVDGGLGAVLFDQQLQRRDFPRECQAWLDFHCT